MDEAIKKLKGFFIDDESDDDYEGPGVNMKENEPNLKQYFQETLMRQQFRMQNRKSIENYQLNEIENLRKKRTKKLEKSGYQLIVYLMNVRPKFYRRFVVPGDISLYDLNDRVLSPIWGLCRNYHGHFFKKFPMDSKNRDSIRNIGDVYGPKAAGVAYVDLMHCSSMGINMLDDEEVLLCDVLQKQGEKMLHVYDIGDQFMFKITVEKLIQSKYKREIYLIDGQGCSIPEDGNGNYTFAENLMILSNKNHPSFSETVNNLNGSINYATNGEFFPVNDPKKFDLKKYQRVLQICIRGDRICVTGWRAKWHLPINSYQYKRLKKDMKFCRCCGKKEKKIKMCSNCNIAFYCCSECQVKDWKMRHKKECRKLNLENQKKTKDYR